MPKRIGIVSNTTWNIANFRQNVIQKLEDEGYDVFVIAPVDEYISCIENFKRAKHIALRSLRRSNINPIRDIVLIEEFRRKYKRLKLDVVLHYTHKPNIFGTIAAKIVGIPSINVVTGLGYTFINKGVLNYIAKILYKIVSTLSSATVFENRDDKKLFVRSSLSKKENSFSVKGCGVDLDYFNPKKLKTFNVNKKSFRFTFIGRLLKDKGILEFVAAGKMIKNNFPHIKLDVVGDLDLINPTGIKEDLLVEWANNDWITYHGFADDIRAIISKTDCVVLPSYREGMPRTLIEAAACAKPIITTDVPGCRETVESHKNGLLVNVKDVSSLNEAMKKMLNFSNAEILEMGKESRKLAERHFDQKNIAEEIFNIVQEYS